jgi:hypothetical protein
MREMERTEDAVMRGAGNTPVALRAPSVSPPGGARSGMSAESGQPEVLRNSFGSRPIWEEARRE